MTTNTKNGVEKLIKCSEKLQAEHVKDIAMIFDLLQAVMKIEKECKEIRLQIAEHLEKQAANNCNNNI